MRKIINIVWLEDNQNETYKKNKKIVEEKIQSKGYKANIEEFNSFDAANDFVHDKKNRIDFFISDYNLGNGKTGLDYLISMRRARKYKEFFILYSNNTEEQIQSYVIEKLEDVGIVLLSNFMAISLADYSGDSLKGEFHKSIDVCLAWWDELNALRGEYIVENLELDLLLRDCLGYEDEDKITYCELINIFFDVIESIGEDPDLSIKYKWIAMKDKRNALAHVKEVPHEQGYLIESLKNDLQIYESDIDQERLELLSQKEEILKYFGQNEKAVRDHCAK